MSTTWLLVVTGLAGVLLLLVPGTAESRQQDGHPSSSGQRAVTVVEVDHPIDRVSARFLERAIEEAQVQRSEVVVVRLDTPGGLLDATREMVADILGSDVPVVCYVGPDGAHAASAGTFVAAACALLAMAPATSLGSASVVAADGGDLPPTLSRKATEDAAALMRSIATRRDRPVGPLEATVIEAVSYSASESVELGIADLVTDDLRQLLAEIHGMALWSADGPRVVRTLDAAVSFRRMNMLERVLSFLADPNLAFLFISLGGLALAVEIFSPGLGVPGLLGLLLLITGFAGVSNLPFSWAGVVLLAAGVILLVAEALMPGFGVFGVAGLVSLVLGGLFLFGSGDLPRLEGPSVLVDRGLLAGVSAVGAVAVAGLVRESRRSRAGGYVSPYSRDRLIGEIGVVTVRLAPAGQVRAAGETWTAECEPGISVEIGEHVQVTGWKQLGLVVAALEARDTPSPSQVDTQQSSTHGANRTRVESHKEEF